MSWFNEHLENFVKPVLGFIPKREPSSNFTTLDMSIIKNAWRSVKSEKKPILLLGRDVWIFEVLARRENYPTKFIPQCSRLAINYIEIPNVQEYFILDTGFMGSIPAALKTENFKLLSYGIRNSLKQIFPNMGGSRSLALKIEKTPKYWKSGYCRDGFVGQEFSPREEFISAVQLTYEIYTNSSPKFTEKKYSRFEEVNKWKKAKKN